MNKEHEGHRDEKEVELPVATMSILQERIGRGDKFQFLNVSNAPTGIITGSKPMAANEIEKRLPELDKAQDVIVYANDVTGESKQAARLLAREGFKVSIYPGGLKEWRQYNLPVDRELQEVKA